MKANELMIGDWVTCKKWRENPFKFTRINDNGKYYYGVTSNGTQVGPFLPEEIEPITLTTEILEKNGFKKSERTRFGAGYFLEGENFELDNPSNPNNYLDNYWLLISIKSVRINYIHQLQHALRLCGIDKTIEL